MQISTPIRPDDFVNSRNAVLEWTEELVAVDRLKFSDVEPREWGGFTLRLNGSQRFFKWLFDRHDLQHHFLIERAELDRFGSQLLLPRPTSAVSFGSHAAICPWTASSKAAQYLREFCIGPADGPAILPVYVEDIINALQIPEQASNSSELPSYSQVKWGTLLRLDGANVSRTLDYLLFDRPADYVTPVKIPLGANCFAVVASSPSKEALRIGLGPCWNDDLIIKDLSRWLKSFLPRIDNRKEANT
jgi:hypothetical protein